MPGKRARLLIRDANGGEREVEISHVPFTIGRQSDNDLVLLDNRISRSHARILEDEENYHIEDAGSRHGTMVNGARISGCHSLQNGDAISLGVADAYSIKFIAEEAVLPDLLARLEHAGEGPAPQLQHLGLLLQMAQIMHHAPALEEVLTTLVDTALKLTGADRGLLFVVDDDGALKLQVARDRDGANLRLDITDYSHRAVEKVAKTGHEQVALEDRRTGTAAHETGGFTQESARGVVAVPLQKLPMAEMTSETIVHTAPKLLGVLYLDSRSRPTSATGLDRQVLETLAVEGATVIENARLFRITRQQERDRHELALARSIQQSLLPRQLPEASFFDLHALTMSCQTVGGDFYDVISLPGNRYGLVVADVSCKGLPAAMLAVTLQGAFTAVASGDPDLVDLFKRVNRLLCEKTPPEMYATVFYGVLDPSGLFQFVNAGHVPPLLHKANGEMQQLGSPSFPLGLFSFGTFAIEKAALDRGDQVLICSDGVSEAQNLSHDFFGEARLYSLMAKLAGLPANEVCTHIVTELQQFAGLAPQADDITLSLIRFNPPHSNP